MSPVAGGPRAGANSLAVSTGLQPRSLALLGTSCWTLTGSAPLTTPPGFSAG
jgi:hypothetical protein